MCTCTDAVVSFPVDPVEADVACAVDPPDRSRVAGMLMWESGFSVDLVRTPSGRTGALVLSDRDSDIHCAASVPLLSCTGNRDENS